MDLILDTHTFLWFIDGNHEISTIVKNKITNPKTVKHQFGKLRLNSILENFT